MHVALRLQSLSFELQKMFRKHKTSKEIGLVVANKVENVDFVQKAKNFFNGVFKAVFACLCKFVSNALCQ
jgi:hypothetical protein